jgi:N-acetylmuramoyl-L-alanine amidase
MSSHSYHFSNHQFAEKDFMPNYTVRQGDCISSIAEEYGFFWETIWNHPNNAELRQTRGNPNLLNPGDSVFIPEMTEREESSATEQRHRFRRKGIPEVLRIRLLNGNDEPIANEQYVIEIDGILSDGSTNSDGEIEIAIPPNARAGRIVLSESGEEFPIRLGQVDPINSTSGVQARLNNLGYDCGPVDGVLGERTRSALQAFQRHHDIEQSGEIDQMTQDALHEKYGC